MTIKIGKVYARQSIGETSNLAEKTAVKNTG